MAARRQVGELEAEVLSVLAGSDGWLTPSEVQSALDGDLAYTTVATILTRLCTKELATREGEGRTFRYRLAVDESDLIAGRMHSQLRHANDPAGALGQFVSGLSPDEEAALRAVLGKLVDDQWTSASPSPLSDACCLRLQSDSAPCASTRPGRHACSLSPLASRRLLSLRASR